MSRYTLLFLLNLPLITLALLSTLTKFKMNHISRRRFVGQSLLWLFVLGGLLAAHPVYEWLLLNGFTDTDSLSLFDVIQITTIILLLYLLNSLHGKVEAIEQKVNQLHQELSIRLSNKK